MLRENHQQTISICYYNNMLYLICFKTWGMKLTLMQYKRQFQFTTSGLQTMLYCISVSSQSKYLILIRLHSYFFECAFIFNPKMLNLVVEQCMIETYGVWIDQNSYGLNFEYPKYFFSTSRYFGSLGWFCGSKKENIHRSTTK